jgi:hypothetical protein
MNWFSSLFSCSSRIPGDYSGRLYTLALSIRLREKQEILTVMGKFNEEMVKAGVILAGEGLHRTSKGARIKFQGGKKMVIGGPFTESKELIAGFWLIQVKSKEEAIAWMQRAPFGDGVVLEIRKSRWTMPLSCAACTAWARVSTAFQVSSRIRATVSRAAFRSPASA